MAKHKRGRSPAKSTRVKSSNKPKSTSKLTKADKASEYRKIKGDPARRYQKVGGRKIISRRQHDALLSREHVIKRAPPKQFSPERTSGYWDYVREWKSAQERKESIRDISKSTEFRERFRALKSKDNSPTGKKAQFLVELGWRDPKATYNVGDSPKGRKGKAA